jgi:hypothetical protein
MGGGSGAAFDPPYDYEADPADDVPPSCSDMLGERVPEA